MLVTAVPFAATAEESTASQAPLSTESFVDLDTLYVEGMTAHFSVFGENASSVNLKAKTWTDLVAGKTATFSVGGTDYWQINANGSVGYTSFRGELVDGALVASSANNNYKKAGNRLQLGLSLLPESDFSVEYLVMYKPLYVYDANETDKIARNTDASYMETYFTELVDVDPGYHVEYPIDQLGWFTSFTSYMDHTKHVWDTWVQSYEAKNPYSVERGATHFLFDCPTWYYKRYDGDISHNNWYLGGLGHRSDAGLNIKTDAYQKNNEINTYGIYLDETETVSNDATVTTALFSIYRNATLYNSNASKINSSANADGGTTYYSAETPYSDKHNFWLSSTRATDFFSVRIYNKVLTDAEKKQNRAVDVMNYYGVKIPVSWTGDEALLSRIFDAMAAETLVTDPLAYHATALAVQAKVDACNTTLADIDALYVKGGLVALYTAFAGDSEFLTAKEGGGLVWKNRVQGASDATFVNTGWVYNAAQGGVGFDLVYGQIDQSGTFSTTYSGNTYYRENRLELGLSLLPKEDFTLEYVALYTPHYVYDARVGKLVNAAETGISNATTPNQIIGHPVDVIGFMASYTMHRGNMFDATSTIENKVGLLRWRCVDANGYKTWNADYGMANGNRIDNRGTYGVETYGLSRDESKTGTEESPVVTATYTHLFNGGVQHTISCTSTKASGDNRYYTFEDDTDFYLSDKLGTTFYALRIYNRVLSAEEQEQNRMADVLGYYDIAIPEDFFENGSRYDYISSLCKTVDFEHEAKAYTDTKQLLQSAMSENYRQVTLLVGEREITEEVYGTSYTLPKSVDGDATLFAWHLLDAEGEVTERCAPGDTVELSAKETTFRALLLSSPVTNYGVSVRAMGNDGFGMRFTSTVNKSEMKAIIDEYGGENIQLSILITPKAYVDRAGGFTREKLRSYVVANGEDASRAYIEIRSSGFYSVGEDVCTIAGTIYNFSSITIKKNPAFAAIGCIDVDTDGDGTYDKTVYGAHTASTCRSPKKVLEGIRYMGTSLTNTQEKWVEDFLKNYADGTYGGDKTVATQRAEIQNAFTNAMNMAVDYTVHPFAEGEVDAKYAHIQAISFDGLSMGGKKTRIFAYVGLPEGASAANPVPAMVLVHGGGGNAYMEWVRLWNERGYAAIAMETVGAFPTSPGTGVTEGNVSAERELPDYICDVIDESEYVIAPDRMMKTAFAEVDEHWQYHGLSAVILSHNVLRQNAAVDASRIGAVGVSWGGTMVSQVIGYDTRFAFAIPIYGSAYISEPERPFISSAYVDDLWAAERNLDNYKNPILWFDWADDNNFVVSSYSKSYLHSRKNNPKTALALLKDWSHGHRVAWNLEHGYAFADSICFPEEKAAYATFTVLPEGNSAESTVCLPQGATDVSASLVYLTEPMVYKRFVKYFESSWLEEYWQRNDTCLAIDTETGRITGKIPKDVLFYYICVSYTVEGKTLETSSNFVSVYDGGRLKEKDAPIHNIAFEELGVPTAEKYPTGERARLAWDMAFYEGKVYLGSGDYGNNRGPAQISCYDPKAGAWEASATVPDEEVNRFCVLSGALCAPGVDPRETDWSVGTYYVLENGEWTVKNTVSGGIHNYDMVEFHGKLFAGLGVDAGGYPVSVSTDGGESFTSVPFQKDGAAVSTAGYEYIRTYDFFVQGNTLYATLTLDDSYEIYRYDESLGVFLYKMNFKENVKISKYKINPLGEKVSFDGSIYFTTGYLYQTTDFETLTPITLPGSVRVFDLFVAEDTLYVLGADQLDDGKYKTTVYALEKGASAFKTVFDFLYDVPAISMVVEGEDFYIGMGTKSLVSDKNGMLLHVNIDK